MKDGSMNNTQQQVGWYLLKGMVLLCVCLFIGMYAWIAVAHLRFPFALEWIEGSMLDHVNRLLSGQQLYCRPSVEFVPAIYPPLFFYIAAGLAKAVGATFFSLRLLSVVASLLTFALLYEIVKRETGSRFSGLLAAGLFAATYRISGTYFDLGRIDMLFLFLYVWTVFSLRFSRSLSRAFLTGVLLTCSALTKQTGLVLAAPLIVYSCLYRPWKYTGVFCAVAGILLAGCTAGFDLVHEGWYRFYLFVLPGQHPVFFDRIADFWTQDIFFALPFSCACVAVFLFTPSQVLSKETKVFYLLIVLAMVLVTCMTKIKSGGYKNVLMLSYAALAITTGLAQHSVCALQKKSLYGKVCAVVMLFFCLLQFSVLLYDPRPLMPGRGAKDVYARTISALKLVDGEIFAPAYGYLSVIAGKTGTAHIGAINDILRGDPGPERSRLISDIRSALAEKRYAAVVMDRTFSWFQNDIETHYTLVKDFPHKTGTWPLIKYFYVPRQ